MTTVSWPARCGIAIGRASSSSSFPFASVLVDGAFPSNVRNTHREPDEANENVTKTSGENIFPAAATVMTAAAAPAGTRGLAARPCGCTTLSRMCGIVGYVGQQPACAVVMAA
ncbi:hypothetical protein, partial [Mycobacterium avium]|uniref:hypothetical protein n=1 Tax=Mycobacterium avium TaxID=1764 RepID=UPI001F2004FF